MIKIWPKDSTRETGMGDTILLTAGDPCTRYTAIKVLPNLSLLYISDTQRKLLKIGKSGGVEIGSFDTIITSINTLADERVVALGCHDGALIIKDQRARTHSTVDRHKAAVTTLNTRLTYELLSGSDDGVVAVWDVRSMYKPLVYIRSHNYAISSLSVCDDAIVSTSLDGSVKVWDATRGTLLHTDAQLGSCQPIYDATLTSKQVLYTTGSTGLGLFAVTHGLQRLRSEKVEQLNKELHDIGPFSRVLNAQTALFLANHSTIVRVGSNFNRIDRYLRSTTLASDTEPPPVLAMYNNHVLYSNDDSIRIMSIDSDI